MANEESVAKAQRRVAPALPECFVVMPISDPEGYESGHFQHVFDDIFSPACERAGFAAVRADQVRETNLIHLDLLQRLLRSPMVLCDLSTRNPNVLFELGLRQAFDKPVAIVQEVDTPRIFDIAPLRFTEYRKERIYHQVLEDQENISRAVAATKVAFEKGTGINSIVRILALTQPAALPEVQEANRDPALQIVRAELSELRNDLRRFVQTRSETPFDPSSPFDIERLESEVDLLELIMLDIEKTGTVPPGFRNELRQTWNAIGQRINRSSQRKDIHSLNNLANRLELLRNNFSKIMGDGTDKTGG
jgi:hypothetical protein